MTTVYLYRKNNHYCGFEFSDHADGDVEGEGKLVCAALSITSISAVNAIDALTEAIPFVEMETETGYLKCMLESDLSADTLEKTDLIIGHLSIAVMGLVEEYPHNVKLYTREVEEHA